MKLITGTGNPYIEYELRPSAVTSAGSGRLRALAWLSAAALAGMLSACAIDAPGSSRSPSTGVDEPNGTCEHDLCEAGAALDPSCDGCVADVCAVDDFCCTVEWDSVCVGQAQDLCGLDCGIAGCEHDLCEAGSPLDPTCDPCVEAVCLANPACCDGAWDQGCVELAAATCGLDCIPGGNCEHPLCEAGTPLDPTCDPCVTTVCSADAFCCEVEWDAVCVDLGEQLCGIDCDGGGNCEHDLCEVGAPLDPTCDPCVTNVCNIDSFCCEVEWDQICVDLAADTCGLDCGGGECEHDLCEVGTPLDPTCDTCVADVCNIDSFCCEVEWDQICIDLAVDTCGIDCGGGNCEHDLCEVGTPLDPTCDTCVADVCAIDSFCCEVEWDAICIDLAVQTCGIDCGGGNCEHDLCEVGAPLDPACDTCVADVCNIDSFCCEVEWDAICVDLAVSTCGLDCGGGECEHDLCETGSALDPACDPCVGAVCDFDSFCCETEWDSICVGEAEEICGIDCGGEPPAECGNGSCEVGEHCLSCPEDCGECPACPHDVCDIGVALPFGCNSCTPNVCKVDSFCCEVAWDSICVGLVPQHCARPCE